MSTKQPSVIHNTIISFDTEYDNSKAWEFRTGLINRSIKHTTSRTNTRLTSIYINTVAKKTMTLMKKWLKAQGVGVSFKVLDQSLYAGTTQ